MITRNRDLLQATGEPDAVLLRSVIAEFQQGAERRDKLRAYFKGEHAISGRTRAHGLPNAKLAHDFPGYIVEMATGYLVGNAVNYTDATQEKALEAITAAYDRDSIDSVDSEIATEASVYGVGVEICYAGQDSMPHAAQVDRRQAFVVYDDTVEAKPLFGVHWMKKQNALGEDIGLRAFVYTPQQVIHYEGADLAALVESKREEHYFGAVPIVEYWNNPQERGDFENVLSLVDAYDLLQSDRVNDKQQFVDALLVLFGVVGGIAPPEEEEAPADPTEEGQPAAPVKKDTRTAGQRIRDEGVLVMPDGAKAEYLAKQLDEADVEVLKNAIKSDIHKFSQVPDLTDEKFAGNSSGVAMKFKLLGLEQKTKIKERWFREGLRWRLRLYGALLATKGKLSAFDADAVAMTFTRALPVNEVEIAQTVQQLQGLVPNDILLGLLPFVSDVKAALESLEKQKAAAVELQRQAFGGDYPDANKDKKPGFPAGAKEAEEEPAGGEA